MDARAAWDRTGRWAAGLLVVAYVALGTYAGDGWVFPLSQASLGFHELGHLLTMFWAPQPLVSFAGSATQVLVPLGLALYFWKSRTDLFATSIMLAWAGTALNDVSIYIYDATRRELPLLGDASMHDWAYLLGPGVLDALHFTDQIAYATRGVSVLLFVGAVAVVGYGFARPRLARREAEELEEFRATLPVREAPVRPRAADTPSEGDNPVVDM